MPPSFNVGDSLASSDTGSNRILLPPSNLFIAALLISKITTGGQRLYLACPVFFYQQPLLLASTSRSSLLSSTCSSKFTRPCYSGTALCCMGGGIMDADGYCVGGAMGDGGDHIVVNRMQLGTKELYEFLTKWGEGRQIEEEKKYLAIRTDELHKWWISLYRGVFNILKITTTTHNDIVCISFNSKSAHSNPPIYIYMQKVDSLSFPTVLGSRGRGLSLLNEICVGAKWLRLCFLWSFNVI